MSANISYAMKDTERDKTRKATAHIWSIQTQTGELSMKKYIEKLEMHVGMNDFFSLRTVGWWKEKCCLNPESYHCLNTS